MVPPTLNAGTLPSQCAMTRIRTLPPTPRIGRPTRAPISAERATVLSRSRMGVPVLLRCTPNISVSHAVELMSERQAV